MPRTISEEESPTEDEIARKKLGPRGLPGGRGTAKMTPQQEKNIPKNRRFRRPYRLTEISCRPTWVASSASTFRKQRL
jgi:hypothetical protein